MITYTVAIYYYNNYLPHIIYAVLKTWHNHHTYAHCWRTYGSTMIIIHIICGYIFVTISIFYTNTGCNHDNSSTRTHIIIIILLHVSHHSHGGHMLLVLHEATSTRSHIIHMVDICYSCCMKPPARGLTSFTWWTYAIRAAWSHQHEVSHHSHGGHMLFVLHEATSTRSHIIHMVDICYSCCMKPPARGLTSFTWWTYAIRAAWSHQHEVSHHSHGGHMLFVLHEVTSTRSHIIHIVDICYSCCMKPPARGLTSFTWWTYAIRAAWSHQHEVSHHSHGGHMLFVLHEATSTRSYIIHMVDICYSCCMKPPARGLTSVQDHHRSFRNTRHV